MEVGRQHRSAQGQRLAVLDGAVHLDRLEPRVDAVAETEIGLPAGLEQLLVLLRDDSFAPVILFSSAMPATWSKWPWVEVRILVSAILNPSCSTLALICFAVSATPVLMRIFPVAS